MVLTPALAETLREILGRNASIVAVDLADVDLGDLPPELELARVKSVRQREYAGGRIAAHRALAAIGHKPAYPMAGPGREPLWPQGLVGSITHTDDVAVAAAAPASAFAGIGIDIERIRPLDPGIAARILTVAETGQFGLGGAEPDPGALLRLFSFKESIYKCVFPVFGEFIGFRAVGLRAADDGLRAACTDPQHPAAGLVARIRGDSRRIDNHVVSACWLPAGA